MYDHFIITRFNLKKDDWNSDKNSEKILDHLWLSERIELFKNYCMPSVLGQTNKNFRWLIFFEKSTEHEVLDLVELMKPYSFIEAVFLNGYKEFQLNSPKLLKSKMKSSSNSLLTTRLDNDDAIHENFIKEIQNSINFIPENSIIQFPYGICLQHRKNKRLAIQYYPLNQFLTLFEKIDPSIDPLTVLGKEHTIWKEEGWNIHDVGNELRWLQVVHERNMLNSFNGTPVLKKHLKGFNIENDKFNWQNDIMVILEKILRSIGLK
jgi:hypothetical protein